MERLQKVIAESGYCSRRKAEEYIKEGKVEVNGKVVTELGTKVSYDDEIVVNHKCLQEKEEKEYYLFYKPEKIISSVKDEKGRTTVVDFIDTQSRIYPVGRLDYDTTGLLLLTNDGELANLLTHPSTNIEKVYLVKINGILSGEELKRLKTGIEIEGRVVKLQTLKVKKINKETNTSSILLGVTEGRNHIIKKLIGSLGYKVLKLKRESFAFLTLEGLKPGEYRTLSIKEVKKLYSLK